MEPKPQAQSWIHRVTHRDITNGVTGQPLDRNLWWFRKHALTNIIQNVPVSYWQNKVVVKRKRVYIAFKTFNEKTVQLKASSTSFQQTVVFPACKVVWG